jgi:hypothetical protein
MRDDDDDGDQTDEGDGIEIFSSLSIFTRIFTLVPISG